MGELELLSVQLRSPASWPVAVPLDGLVEGGDDARRGRVTITTDTSRASADSERFPSRFRLIWLVCHRMITGRRVAAETEEAPGK